MPKISLSKVKELKPGMTLTIEIAKEGEIPEEVTLPVLAVKKIIRMRDDFLGIEIGSKFRITAPEGVFDLEII